MKHRFLAVSTALFACFFWYATPASAVDCGDTISSDVTLDPAVDFTSACLGAPAARNITGPAVVDLNGVIIECSDPFVAIASIGISISGDGVVLKNGGVKNCTGGVVVNGNGTKVSGVYVTAKTFAIHDLPAIGFSITGEKNSIRNSSVRCFRTSSSVEVAAT